MKFLAPFLLLALTFSTVSASDNTNNISANPVGLLVGVANVAYDRKVSDQFTLGGEIAFINYEDGTTTQSGEQYGVRARYHFDKAFQDGWLLAGSLGYVQTEVEMCLWTSCATAEAKGFYAGLVPTYMWMWENFNINLGLGVIYYKVNVEATAGSTSIEAPLDGIEPTIDFSLGWAF